MCGGTRKLTRAIVTSLCQEQRSEPRRRAAFLRWRYTASRTWSSVAASCFLVRRRRFSTFVVVLPFAGTKRRCMAESYGRSGTRPRWETAAVRLEPEDLG